MAAEQQLFRKLHVNTYTLVGTPGGGDDNGNRDKRRTIVKSLQNKLFGVFTDEVKKEQIEKLKGDGENIKMKTEAVITSMVWVMAYYDGTNKTGIIKSGQPVVFDTCTGRCVTGINEEWFPDEYKIIGRAWQGKTDEGESLIPVTLGEIPKNDYIMLGIVEDDEIQANNYGYVKIGGIDGIIKKIENNRQPLYKGESVLISFNYIEHEYQVVQVEEEEHLCTARDDIAKDSLSGIALWTSPGSITDIEIPVKNYLGDIKKDDLIIIRWIKKYDTSHWLIVETECGVANAI